MSTVADPPRVLVVSLLVIIVALVGLLVRASFFTGPALLAHTQGVGSDSAQNTSPLRGSPLGEVSGTTGHLFGGDKVREFKGSWRFSTVSPEALGTLARPLPENSEWLFPQRSSCHYWAVVTTIFPPTLAIEKQAHLPDWCMVIVADRKGPLTYTVTGKTNYVYLTVEAQERMQASSSMVKLLPWNHFGRKNVGFLYAVANGARAVYDFDDDNVLMGKHRILLPGDVHNVTTGHVTNTPTVAVRRVRSDYNHSIFNPYPHFGPNAHSNLWPRGFPLGEIKSTYMDHSHPQVEMAVEPTDSIGIVQYLANGDPDVDAIYRLTAPMPVDFALHGFAPLLLPHRSPTSAHPIVYTPFNAQTTLLLPPVFWSMLLPVTVHGRVSDIWRSYIAQRLLYLVGQRLVFHAPVVLHMRNDHNYLADFEAEVPLYREAAAFLRHLDLFACSAPTLAGCLEGVYVMLYEHGFLQLDDVQLAQAWIADLAAMGYHFPALRRDLVDASNQPRAPVAMAEARL